MESGRALEGREVTEVIEMSRTSLSGKLIEWWYGTQIPTYSVTSAEYRDVLPSNLHVCACMCLSPSVGWKFPAQALVLLFLLDRDGSSTA